MYIEKGLITSLHRGSEAWEGVCCFPLLTWVVQRARKWEVGSVHYSMNSICNMLNLICLQDGEVEGFKMN